MKPISVRLLSFLLSRTVAQQFVDDDDLSWGSYGEDVFTPEYRAALNTTLNCSWMLGEYITHELGEVTDENLDEICTPQCFDSLPKVQKHIHQACPRDDNWVELQNKGIDFATDIIDDIARGHQEDCSRASRSLLPRSVSLPFYIYLNDAYTNGARSDTDELCLSVMRNWTWEYEAKNSCANCLIGLKELYLNSTEKFDKEAYDEFTSLTQSCNWQEDYNFYSVCICQVSGYQPVSPSKTTKISETRKSTATGKFATPTLITDGMRKNCNKFYRVKKGDYCEKICKENGISMKDFTAWNPDVKFDCSLVQKDYYYCVG
ncbi:hypothetical protein ACHAPU_010074 [Fusarium lateritium]